MCKPLRQSWRKKRKHCRCDFFKTRKWNNMSSWSFLADKVHIVSRHGLVTISACAITQTLTTERGAERQSVRAHRWSSLSNACRPLRGNKDELRPFGSGARFYVQQHVILYVCVAEKARERETAWSGLWRGHGSTGKVSRLRTGQPSSGTDHSTPVSLSTDTTSLRVPNDIADQNQNRNAKRY